MAVQPEQPRERVRGVDRTRGRERRVGGERLGEACRALVAEHDRPSERAPLAVDEHLAPRGAGERDGLDRAPVRSAELAGERHEGGPPTFGILLDQARRGLQFGEGRHHHGDRAAAIVDEPDLERATTQIRRQNRHALARRRFPLGAAA